MGLAANLLAKRFSVEELEKQLDAVLKEHMGGKSVIEWQVGDSSAKKGQWLNFPPVVRLNDIAQALSILDPVSYPADSVTAITQTRVTFT
jgi:hypothetical protein